jgi:membrane-bound ClpP family serine protease
MASDISGASFAFAIVTLSVGRVTMFATRIFRDKRKEEGRQQGRQEMKALVLRAIRDRQEGETVEQAIERVIGESREGPN